MAPPGLPHLHDTTPTDDGPVTSATGTESSFCRVAQDAAVDHRALLNKPYSVALMREVAERVRARSSCNILEHPTNTSDDSPSTDSRTLKTWESDGVDVETLDPCESLLKRLADVNRSSASVYVANLSAVVRRLIEFRTVLPSVTPYYAVKCNPDPIVIATLAALGCRFDCASTAEIDLVLSHLDAYQSASKYIIYANPCKQESHLDQARRCGVRLTTFDSEDELRKIARVHPDAKLLLRIAVDDSSALCPLSSKFGAPRRDIPRLLSAAEEMGLAVVGVAFHVGSGCTAVSSYQKALRRAREVFDIAESFGNHSLTILDIGGGFPSTDDDSNSLTMRAIGDAVREEINLLFRDTPIEVIAEPGRYLVGSAFGLATRVLLRRPDSNAVVIGNGVFGSFRDAVVLSVPFEPSCVFRQPNSAHASVVQLSKTSASGYKPCTLLGPSCDAQDVVARDVDLPHLLPGDWLCFLNMGSYTSSLATTFDVETPEVLYFFES